MHETANCCDAIGQITNAYCYSISISANS